jgi:hypothetical protein
LRAARVSSSRARNGFSGAALTAPASVRASSTMARMPATNRSSVSFDSLSVGSIMSAPWTTSGK